MFKYHLRWINWCGAIVIGNLADGANPSAFPTASNDPISRAGGETTQLSLIYGGFDVGEDTAVGSPTGNFVWNGVIQLVPEPSSSLLMAF